MEHVNLIVKILAHNPLPSLYINNSHWALASDLAETRTEKQQEKGKTHFLLAINLEILKAILIHEKHQD